MSNLIATTSALLASLDFLRFDKLWIVELLSPVASCNGNENGEESNDDDTVSRLGIYFLSNFIVTQFPSSDRPFLNPI